MKPFNHLIRAKHKELQMTDFRNKNVLITGAAMGIGRLMAEKIAELGGNLFLWDIDRAGLDSLQEELQRRGSQTVVEVCNLTDRAAIYAAAERALQQAGGIDVLINNAGVVSGKFITEASDEEILRTFQVNVLAHFWTTRAFLPGMIRRNSGHVVTIASAAGIVAPPRLADYSASKHAAVGFTDSLRLELRRQKSNVRTTLVCPYYIDTGMFAGVKTRIPWLLPIMKPGYVVNRIIKAVRRNRQRLVLPWFVLASYPCRILPTFMFDALIDWFGINRSMDEFTGRPLREKQ